MFKFILGAILLVLLIASCGAMSGTDKSSSSSGKDEGEAAFTIKGFCVATGIADLYTGDGKVVFYVKIRNIGTKTGSDTFTPIRRYSDGEENRSAMDTTYSPDIAPGGVWKGRTPAFSYKAHEHEVIGCAADHHGDEVEFAVR